MKLKSILLNAAGFLLAGSVAQAAPINYTFTFDGVPNGTAVNTIPQPAVVGTSFYNAIYTPNLDAFGDPIAGTEKWRIDTDPTTPAVTAENPSLYARGAAPSPTNALQALFQPVIVTFAQPINLTGSGFSGVLDNDTFGSNGFLAGFSDIAVKFYDTNNTLLQSVPIDQTTPGFAFTNPTALANVSYVVLPAGAFYDNLAIVGNSVPEPASFGLLLLPAMVVLQRRARKN